MAEASSDRRHGDAGWQQRGRCRGRGRRAGIREAKALRPINVLADAGVLTESTGFRRNRIWQSREVMAALDEFAARAGRRG